MFLRIYSTVKVHFYFLFVIRLGIFVLKTRWKLIILQKSICSCVAFRLRAVREDWTNWWVDLKWVESIGKRYDASPRPTTSFVVNSLWTLVGFDRWRKSMRDLSCARENRSFEFFSLVHVIFILAVLIYPLTKKNYKFVQTWGKNLSSCQICFVCASVTYADDDRAAIHLELTIHYTRTQHTKWPEIMEMISYHQSDFLPFCHCAPKFDFIFQQASKQFVQCEFRLQRADSAVISNYSVEHVVLLQFFTPAQCTPFRRTETVFELTWA